MRYLINKIRCFFSFVDSLLFKARRDLNNMNHGVWLHDKEGRERYKEVQLVAVPKDSSDVYRVKANYNEKMWEIPGLNGTGVTRYPFPDGNWAIKVAFSSKTQLNDVMKRDRVPPLLDGIPVIIRDTPATYTLE